VVCFCGLLEFRSQLLLLFGFWAVCTVEWVGNSRGVIELLSFSRSRVVIRLSFVRGTNHVQLTSAISADIDMLHRARPHSGDMRLNGSGPGTLPSESGGAN